MTSFKMSYCKTQTLLGAYECSYEIFAEDMGSLEFCSTSKFMTASSESSF